MSAVLYPHDGRVRVGHGLTKSHIKPRPVPLAVSQASPRAWLLVAYILGLDPEREYLTVLQSAYSVYLDEDMRHPSYDTSMFASLVTLIPLLISKCMVVVKLWMNFVEGPDYPESGESSTGSIFLWAGVVTGPR